MSRALVAIGVSRCGRLRALPGAITDATEMVAWANGQNYDFVKGFTDQGGGVVSFRPIYDWINDVLVRGVERLIICYSGHGYAPLNGHEVWLLSNWEDDGNEAINASGTITYAQGYTSPQICFIADACRTTYSTNAPSYGSVLLPRPGSRPAASQVDQFYATKFGFVALETGDSTASFGVFSAEVRKALNGSATAWTARGGNRLVTSRSLEDYLDEAVPEASGRAGAVQQPDTLPQWKEPRDVYADLGPLPAVTRAGGPEAPPPTIAPPIVRAARERTERTIESDRKRFLESEGRKSFETGTGATVVGAEIAGVIGLDDFDVFSENAAVHVRARIKFAQTVLLELKRADWKHPGFAALSIYPELIATAVVDESGVSSLNYAPPLSESRGLHRTRESLAASEVLAEATAFLRHGVRLSSERILEIVDKLRMDKCNNPGLAIVAANLCHRTGNWEIIEDMLHYDIGRGPYTPFDLAVLAGSVSPSRSVVGAFPLLSSTWGALATSELPIDQRLLAIAKEILPSFWTMATPAGAQMLAELMRWRTDDLAARGEERSRD